jgi:hypothetical protein
LARPQVWFWPQKQPGLWPQRALQSMFCWLPGQLSWQAFSPQRQAFSQHLLPWRQL